MIKVFLGGEGANDIGTRSEQPMGDGAGVSEVLLRRVRPTGWQVDGAMTWSSIRKYRAGAAAKNAAHADVHNVLGLMLQACERGCEMLAFVRDADGDQLRAQAIDALLEDLPDLGYGYPLAVVGGVPRPKLEGWILCLLGLHGSDDLTAAGADRELAARAIAAKSTAAYVAIAETAALPSGAGSLARWLARADITFRRLIDGA